MHWWQRADCLGETRLDPTLPDLERGERKRIARWYCSECEVRPECAADALRHRDTEHIRAGIWLGGTRPDQTPNVKRQLAKIAEGTR